MRILVTGGAGYIGSHTAKAIARAGFEPVVYDNLSTGHRWAIKWGPFVEADLADCSALEQTIRHYDVSAVIHFAAHAYVGESVREPRRYFQNNVIGALNLLEALLRTGVSRVVFSSSCAVYGVPNAIPITEDHLKLPVNPYGESKLFIERVLEWYGRAYDLRWAALRYFNAAGADPDGEIGEAHDPETHLLPLVIEVALGKRRVVDVFGHDYATEDGTAIRDYVHVTDLANAHVLALQSLLSYDQNLAMNLGTGRGFSVREVIAAVERLTSVEVSFRLAPRRPGDPPVLVSDPKVARSLLGWQPHYSDLDNIVQTAFRWHRDGLPKSAGLTELPGRQVSLSAD